MKKNLIIALACARALTVGSSVGSTFSHAPSVALAHALDCYDTNPNDPGCVDNPIDHYWTASDGVQLHGHEVQTFPSNSFAYRAPGIGLIAPTRKGT